MLDPDLKAYLADWDKAWSDMPPTAGPVERRARLEKLSLDMRQPYPAGVTVEERRLSRRNVRVLVFHPGKTGPLPCLLYMHGGAWMQGSPETHEEITAKFAARTGSLVISIDYSLAPEKPFPAAVEDCSAVLKYVFENTAELGVIPDAISVGGDSAGGNLAAVLTIAFRGSEHRIRGQVLYYPALMHRYDLPSFAENANGPIITTAGMPHVLEMYAPGDPLPTDPLIAPYWAGTHAGLPPAFIATAENDPLRDDGIAYVEKLRAAGVSVEHDAGPGLIHGYLRAMTYSAAVRQAFEESCVWFDRLNAAVTGSLASERI